MPPPNASRISPSSSTFSSSTPYCLPSAWRRGVVVERRERGAPDTPFYSTGQKSAGSGAVAAVNRTVDARPARPRITCAPPSAAPARLRAWTCIRAPDQEDRPSMSVAAAHVPPRSSVARFATERSLALAALRLRRAPPRSTTTSSSRSRERRPESTTFAGGLAAARTRWRRARRMARLSEPPSRTARAAKSRSPPASSPSSPAVGEAGYYTVADRAHPATTTPASSRCPAASLLLGIGVVTLLALEPAPDDRLRRRYPRAARPRVGIARADSRRPAAGRGRPTSSPTPHARERPAAAPRRRRTRTSPSRRATDSRLEGWYVPSRNGVAVISAPGRGDSQKPARILALSRLRRPALRPAR